VLPFPEGVPHVLKFSHSGALLLAGGGHAAALGKVVVFDVKTGKRAFEVGDELDVVLAADLNNTHTQIALSGPGKLVRIYSTADGSLLRELTKHTDWVYAVEFSPDGVLLATADRGNGLIVWEAETGREYQNLTGHQAAITDVSWRADSNVLASASLDGSIRLWEMENGKQIKTWNAHPGGVEAIEFTHDGRLLSTGRDKLAKAWNANGGALHSFAGLNDYGLEAAFTHDGARAIAGSLTGQVLVWNTPDAKQVLALSPNPPTLEMLLEVETARATAAEAALNQAQADLQDAQKTLVGLARGERNPLTTIKGEQEQTISAKIDSLKRIDEQISALAAELPKATDDGARQATNEKLAPLNQSKAIIAGELATLHAAIADTYKRLKAETDACNTARATAKKSLDEKLAAIQAATAAVKAAAAARDAVFAEQVRYRDAQAKLAK
jgi:hypothetical protein